MTLKQGSFGSKCVINDDFIKKILKIGLIENIMNDLKSKQVQSPMIGDAINMGTECAQNCILIITEGESARKFVDSGLEIVIDRENWGIYSLRGKLLNVRDASPKQRSSST